MKKLVHGGATSLLALAIGLSAANAATMTPNAPPAVAALSTDAPANAGPTKGANSFTEGQAQARIADAGYTAVSGLKKDDNGIWHGLAMKNGQQVNVWLDFAGHVGQS